MNVAFPIKERLKTALLIDMDLQINVRQANMARIITFQIIAFQITALRSVVVLTVVLPNVQERNRVVLGIILGMVLIVPIPIVINLL